MKKVAVNLSLTATRIDFENDKWLVTSSKKGDITFSAEVDRDMKNALIKMSKLYNLAPKKFTKYICQYKSKLIEYVHGISDPESEYYNEDFENFEVEDWKLVPLIGITDEAIIAGNGEDVPDVAQIKYEITSPAIRIMHCYLDGSTYRTLVALSEDNAEHPMEYYYLITHLLSTVFRLVKEALPI